MFGGDREDAGRLHLDAVDIVLRHGLEHVGIGRVKEVRGEDIADVVAHTLRLGSVDGLANEIEGRQRREIVTAEAHAVDVGVGRGALRDDQVAKFYVRM